MENGLILALFAAVSFAIGIIIVRKMVGRVGESFTATMTSVFMGVPFFAVALFFTGGWDKVWSVSWQAFVLLAVAGIIHFVAGRLLGYNSYRLIGANKAVPFTMTSPFYAVILGVLILKEPVTVIFVLGVVCIFTGAALITTETKSVGEKRRKGFFGGDIRGIMAALGAGICWGITPVLIKPAIGEIGSPLAAAFIAYFIASVVMACLFFRRQHREQISRLPLVSVLIPLIIGAIFASAGQLYNFVALGYSPASLVTPLLSTQILFIFLFSLLLNRRSEVFTLKIVIGMAAIIVGTFLLFR